MSEDSRMRSNSEDESEPRSGTLSQTQSQTQSDTQSEMEQDDRSAASAHESRGTDWSLRELRVPTWELELLISGAVVFTLFRVPAVLARELTQAILHLPESLFLLVFLGVVYLQTAAYVLVAAFIFHLAARAYWIGLIGLYSIFPGGINWSDLKTGPRLREVHRSQIPETPVLIEKTGNLCSGIFSFSFSIVIVILYSAFGAIALFLTSLALQALIFPNVEPHHVFYAALGLVFVPYLAFMGLDKLLAGKTASPGVERVLSGGLDFFTRIFGSRLVNAIQMTFFSNVKRRYVYPIFYVIFFGSLMLTFVRITLDLEVMEVSGYDHFPSVHDDSVMQSAYYRDQAMPGDARGALRPSIQSDVVEDRYVKLLLPHAPRHNEALAEVCPDLEPLRGQGFVRLVPRDSNLDPKLVEETRRCLASLWTVALDDEPLTRLRFEYHVRQPLSIRGLVAYLPTSSMEPGRHVLRVERQRAEDSEADETGGNETGGNRVQDDRTSVYEIPFWI